MHAYDPEDLNDEQRRWALASDEAHQRIQSMLLAIVVSDRPVLRTLESETALAALAHRWVSANLDLWMATEGAARRVIACAEQVHAQLGTALGALSMSNVVINARCVSESMVGMTDVQRRTLLTMPRVAQAVDIAEDCLAEFDNRAQWRRWVARAYPGRGVTGNGLVSANDNNPLLALSPPR